MLKMLSGVCVNMNKVILGSLCTLVFYDSLL